MRGRKAKHAAAAPKAASLPPQVRERILTMKIYEEDREIRKSIREEILAFASEPKEMHEIMRRAVAIAGFPRACPRAACRCTTPFVVCRIERSTEFEPHNNRFAGNDAKFGDPFHGE